MWQQLLEQFPDKKIDISLPEMSDFYKSQLVSGGNNGFVAAYLTVEGISDCTETLIFLSQKSAMKLMNKFINSEGLKKTDASTLSMEEQESIFREIATIIAATYFSAVDTMFNLKTHCGIPVVSFEGGEFPVFINNTLQRNEGISIKTSFSCDDTGLKGNFLLIPTLRR